GVSWVLQSWTIHDGKLGSLIANVHYSMYCRIQDLQNRCWQSSNRSLLCSSHNEHKLSLPCI
ncbi:MAG: hypothetical protein V2I33_25605, partial [Kangiellaceae bacterium]|nr:hypothetical protein [Kangiellaceae bacterium]